MSSYPWDPHSRRPPRRRARDGEQTPLAKRMLQRGVSAGIVVLFMLLGCLGLWIGVPVAWLLVGSWVQGKTNSVGISIVVMLVGAFFSVAVLAVLLGMLKRTHHEMRVARGLPTDGADVLEVVLVVTAVVAMAAFGFWFLVLEGPGPTLFSRGR
jgi:hypothetical protein